MSCVSMSEKCIRYAIGLGFPCQQFTKIIFAFVKFFMIVTPKFSNRQAERLDTLSPEKAKQKRFIAQAVETAVDEGLDPIIEPLSHGEGRRINMSLPGRLDPTINSLSRELRRPKGVVVRGLFEAYLQKHDLPDDDTPRNEQYAQAIACFGWDYRQAQEQCYLNIRQSLEENRIGMVEAATGTGKTYAMLLAAHDILKKHPDARVVIACPTLALIQHFVGAWLHMKQQDPDFPEASTIFGRQEFVSRDQILMAIDQGLYDDRTNKVRKWMESGGRPLDDADNTALPWLAGTLSAIAPDFPVADVLLTAMASDADPGALAYESQFASNAGIVFCSHAMLAVNTRQQILGAQRDETCGEVLQSVREERQAIFRSLEKENDQKKRKALLDEIRMLEVEEVEAISRTGDDWGRLPNYQYLMVDEAHQLENAFSNVLSDFVSARKAVFSLEHYRAKLGRASGVTKANIERAETIIDALIRKVEKQDFETVNITSTDADTRNLIDELGRILGLAKASKTAPQKELWEIREARRKLLAAAKSPYLLLSCSPVRRYPRIISGKPNVSQYLKVLWRSTQGSACLSATLYLPIEGGYSLSYQKECLSLPENRLQKFEPIQPAWIREQVDSVWLADDVALDNRYWLRPPAMRDKLSPQAWGSRERAWLNDVAHSILTITKTAKGGVLVLLTAYTAVEKLHKLLLEIHPELSEQLVIASRSLTLEQQRINYLKKTESGIRPVWLAIGGAWTGMDLSADAYRKIIGKSIKKDWILTDLVIPRIPLGTNRSVTHRYRMERRPAGQWDLQHAMFLLRQGIGRLVRDENLPGHRRIFLLDSRINDPKQKILSTRVRRILRGYTIEKWQPDP